MAGAMSYGANASSTPVGSLRYIVDADVASPIVAFDSGTYLRTGVILNPSAYPSFPSEKLARYTLFKAAMPNANWTAIAWNGSIFCAISTTIAATSPDGITWTQRTLPVGGNWTAIVWNGSIFCAIQGVATTNIAATSPDGITWTQRTLSSSASWSAIAWNGTVFCAVSGGNSTIAATSPDGITWTARTLPAGYWNCVAWNGSVFLTVAGNGTNAAATSPDGITWTARTFLASTSYPGVLWTGSVFYVYQNSGGAGTSPDGITWTTAIGINGQAAVMAGNVIQALGQTSSQTSSDNGATFLARQGVGGNTLTALAYGNSTVVGVVGGAYAYVSKSCIGVTTYTPNLFMRIA